MVPRIAIVGGGISGLAAALRVQERQPTWHVDLFESSSRLGGILGTSSERGYLIEQAADNFLRGPTAPWAEALSRRWNVADQLIPTSELHRGAHVAWRGNLYRVPAGFQLLAPARMGPIITSRLLSPLGKLRLLCEPLIREPRNDRDESLRQFAERRLGREAFERLVEPLVSGIYTADADRLSVAAALPQMIELVRKFGSLYRGMRARQRAAAVEGRDRGARYSLFVAPRGGMTEWIESLAARLSSTTIRYASPVTRLEPSGRSGWQVHWKHEQREQQANYEGVILCLPAPRAAELMRDVSTSLAHGLTQIPHASSSVVCLGYRLQQIGRRLDAFGCVIPSAAQRPALAISYTSLKFPSRAPEGSVLLRVFLGGALHPERADWDDATLEQVAREEVRYWLQVEGNPELVRIVRWPQAMPLYELGHRQRVERIEEAIDELPGLGLAGNAYHGVGVPQCVQSAERAADRVLKTVEPLVVR